MSSRDRLEASIFSKLRARGLNPAAAGEMAAELAAELNGGEKYPQQRSLAFSPEGLAALSRSPEPSPPVGGTQTPPPAAPTQPRPEKPPHTHRWLEGKVNGQRLATCISCGAEELRTGGDNEA